MTAALVFAAVFALVAAVAERAVAVVSGPALIFFERALVAAAVLVVVAAVFGLVAAVAERVVAVASDLLIVVARAPAVVVFVLAAFGLDYLATQGGEFFVYLDDEGAPQPTLSKDYWLGWSEALMSYSRQISSNKVTLLPGLYCNFDHASWVALRDALGQGARCESAWVARWKSSGQVCMPVQPWSQAQVTPDPAPPCPIHIWQYAQECHGGDGFDMDEANPTLSLDDLLAKFILPPS